MKLEVAAYRLDHVLVEEQPWSTMLLEIMPLWDADRLTAEQFGALVGITRRVAEMSAAIE